MNLFSISIEKLHELLLHAQSGSYEPEVVQRLQWFLYYRENDTSVSETCRHFDISRSTFHRWVNRFDPTELTSLAEKTHRPKRLRTSKISEEVINTIRRYRLENPFISKYDIATRLQVDLGTTLSASSIGRIISQQNMYFSDTNSHLQKQPHTPVASTASVTTPEPEVASANEWKNFRAATTALWNNLWQRWSVALITMSLLINAAVIAAAVTTWRMEIKAETDQQQLLVQQLLERENHGAADNTSPPSTSNE